MTDPKIRIRQHQRNMLLAGMLTTVSFALAIGYCVATWPQPHRPAMLGLYGTGAATGAIILLFHRCCVRRVLRRGTRTTQTTGASSI